MTDRQRTPEISPCRLELLGIVQSRYDHSPYSNHTAIQAPAEMAFDGQIASEWDAGPIGCGELILELKLRLARLEPGATFKLIASDPGVPEDLPAWCRMTGHRLLQAEPPKYLIERKSI